MISKLGNGNVREEHLDLKVTYLYSVKFEFYHWHKGIFDSLEKTPKETISPTRSRRSLTADWHHH